MLAAIGLGILAKQAHVMLGVTSVKGSTIELLSTIPDSFLYVVFNNSSHIIIPALIGIISFLILIFYSRLRSTSAVLGLKIIEKTKKHLELHK